VPRGGGVAYEAVLPGGGARRRLVDFGAIGTDRGGARLVPGQGDRPACGRRPWLESQADSAREPGAEASPTPSGQEKAAGEDEGAAGGSGGSQRMLVGGLHEPCSVRWPALPDL